MRSCSELPATVRAVWAMWWMGARMRPAMIQPIRNETSASPASATPDSCSSTIRKSSLLVMFTARGGSVGVAENAGLANSVAGIGCRS